MIYKFVKHDVPELESLSESFPARIHKKLEEREELTREEKNRLVIGLRTNAHSKVGIPLQGWMFDFREWLTEYWVRVKDYGILSVYALDKTSIRECGHFQGIKKIVEIE